MSGQIDGPDMWSVSPVLVAPHATLREVNGEPYICAVGPLDRADAFVGISEAFERFTLIPDEVDAGDAAVRFVREVGWPELCKHGKPDLHDGVRCDMAEDEDGHAVVALRHVLQAAEAMLNIVELADRVNRSRKWTPKAYMAAQRWPSFGFRLNAATDSTQARAFVADWFTITMRQSGVLPTMTWETRHKPSLDFEVDGLVSGLVMEAARLVASGAGARRLRCAACGKPVTLARAPRQGDEVFCPRDPECQAERNRRKARRAYHKRKGTADV